MRRKSSGTATAGYSAGKYSHKQQQHRCEEGGCVRLTVFEDEVLQGGGVVSLTRKIVSAALSRKGTGAYY